MKSCVKWIIVMGLKVLLITHYIIQEILMGTVLDVHVRGVKIKTNHKNTHTITNRR
jgi:hypothetical protein